MLVNQEKIRLSVRHVAFHTGSDYVLRVLEVARKQGKYWQTLETLLASQSRWGVNHTVRSDLVMARLDGFGLNLEQLNRDMNDPHITCAHRAGPGGRKICERHQDARVLREWTPMPTFGYEQLKELVAEELKNTYR